MPHCLTTKVGGNHPHDFVPIEFARYVAIGSKNFGSDAKKTLVNPPRILCLNNAASNDEMDYMLRRAKAFLDVLVAKLNGQQLQTEPRILVGNNSVRVPLAKPKKFRKRCAKQQIRILTDMIRAGLGPSILQGLAKTIKPTMKAGQRLFRNS